MGRGRRLKGAASGRFLTVYMHPVRALLPQDFSMGKRSGCLPPHTIHPVQCDQLCYLESAPSQKARDKEKVRRIAGNASDEEGNENCSEEQRYKRGQQNKSGVHREAARGVEAAREAWGAGAPQRG